MRSARCGSRLFLLSALVLTLGALMPGYPASDARASTYVVYIPLDSPIYNELDTLNGLGLLQTYLSEIRPISRVEAARLTIEADRRLEELGPKVPYRELARAIIDALKSQLPQEVDWLRHGREDRVPLLMLQPLERAEAQYVFSRGDRRSITTGASGVNFHEATPLLPDNDGLPTSPGSNEILRLSSWGGAGGFLSAYGELAVAGPISRAQVSPAGTDDNSRVRLMTWASVASLGNVAVSFGQEEMAWGVGHFASLAQGNNGQPFPAVRIQNVHPGHLPFFLKYLGPFRWQMFFGQLDDDRYFNYPYIDGQIFSFKPLPDFEIGFTHTVQFGGQHNNDYSPLGFIGRATGVATGNPAGANTNSRGGIYLRFFFPRLRNLEVYQEILGEDDLTKELPPVGKILPFLAVSYQGGFYLPRLTSDGLTDLRFEYAILEPNYSIHGDSLYWTYNSQLMGDPLGPNASEVDVQVGRWVAMRYKAALDAFYTERAPSIDTNSTIGAHKERSGGVAFDMWQLPLRLDALGGSLGEIRARTAIEYVSHINYSDGSSTRVLVSLTLGLRPGWKPLEWR